jgi:hypothetical protein
MAADTGGWETIVPSSKAAPTSKAADEGWETISDASIKKPATESGIDWKNIGRTSAETVPSAAAGLTGFGFGLKTGAFLGALTGPAAPVMVPLLGFAGGLGGAFLASGAAQKITDLAHEAFAPEDYKARQAQKAANPYGTFAAQTLTNLAGMSPKTIPEVAGKILTKPLVQRGVSAGLTGSIEAGAEYATEGKIDPIKVLAATAAGAAMPGFNPFGRKAFEAGESAARAVLPKTSARSSGTSQPPPPPPDQPPAGATPEEKAQFLKNLQEAKAQRDSTRPLVETAIRNKETGEIERMGPKHDTQRIADTNATSPPEKGAVRVYRGEGAGAAGESVKSGEWFTTDIEKARRFGNLSYVDLLPEDFIGVVQGHGGKDEHILSEKLRKKAEPFKEEVTYDQGFVDDAGNFLNRQQAADRAVITKQIPTEEYTYKEVSVKSKTVESITEDLKNLQEQLSSAERSDAYDTAADIRKEIKELESKLELVKEYGPTLEKERDVTSTRAKLERPEYGLKSSDLRKAGDERFDLAKIPSEVDGVVITKDLDKVRPDGSRVGASAIRDTRTGQVTKISVDVEHLTSQFEDKSWTKPKVEGVEALPEDAFKTPQEWIDFVIQHEIEHVKTPKYDGQSKADYENQINQAALKSLTEKKLVAEATGEPTKAVVEPEVDRTTTNPRDVKDAQEFFEISQEIFEKHGEVEAIKFFEGYQEYKKTWLEPISETEKYVGINIRNKQANERIIHNEKEEILKGIPNEDRRVAVAEAIDKGDLSGLSKEEIVVANKYQDLVKDIGDRAVKEGVVKGLLDNYVSHILDWVGAPKGAREQFINEIFGKGASDPSMRGMDVTSKFAKERKLPTFQELEAWLVTVNERIAASGKTDWRLKLKTKDIAEVYKEYALSMEKAIENKKLVDNLKQVRNVAGESTIKEVNKDNPMPYGWEMMNIPQFSGYAVHPDMMPALKFVFDAGPGDLMKALGFVSQLSKRMNVIGSFFHAKSLMEVMSSAQIPIWTPLKEAFVLPLVEKAVKTFTGKDLQLSAVSKAVEQFKKGGVGTNVDRWIRQDGLVLEMPEDVAQGVITSIGKFADSMIGKYGPKTRVLEKSLSVVEKYTLGLFDKYTWDYLHTGGKIMVADAYLDKARIKAFEEGRPFDEAQQRKEIARFVNDSFGGINWFDAATQTRTELGKRIAMAAYSPAGRRSLQLALFAPDWTISTVRAFTAALPKQLNPTKWQPVEGIKGMMTPTTKADYARLYQFKTALTYFTLINTINLLTANRPVWENKDPTRIEWPDGTSMQAMKHAMEPYHWMMDPDKTLSNKLGFIPKATVVGIGGIEYASPSAQKLVDPSALGRLKAVASMFLPFQASAAISAPPGESVKRAVLGTMGLPVYGATAEQKKTARAERELILKENSWKYHEKEIKKGREEPSAKHDQIKRSLERSRKKLEEQKGEQ